MLVQKGKFTLKAKYPDNSEQLIHVWCIKPFEHNTVHTVFTLCRKILINVYGKENHPFLLPDEGLAYANWLLYYDYISSEKPEEDLEAETI